MMRTRCPALAWAGSLIGLVAAPVFGAHVGLEFQAVPAPLVLGEEVWVDLYATASSDGQTFPVLGIQSVFTWDPTVLELIDVFMDDGDDSPGDRDFFHFGWGGPLNENSPFPPSDGDGVFIMASILNPVAVTSESELVGTLIFSVLSEAPSTEISLLRSIGAAYTDVRAEILPGFESSVGPQPGTDNLLSSVVVPEPASILLLALGGACVRRRGRHAAS